MIYTDLSHVSIMVSDIDEARRFYGETLGFEEIERPQFGFAGAWFRLNAKVELHLIVPETGYVWPNPGGITAFRYPHFALWSDDIDATIAELSARGCKINLNEAISGVRQVFVFDGDDNMIEFLGKSAPTPLGN